MRSTATNLFARAHRNSRLVLTFVFLTILGMLIYPDAAQAGRSWAPGVKSGPDGPGTGSAALDVAASPMTGSFTVKARANAWDAEFHSTDNQLGLVMEVAYRAVRQKAPDERHVGLDLALITTASTDEFNINYVIVQGLVVPTVRYHLPTRSGIVLSPGIGIGGGVALMIGDAIGDRLKRATAWRVSLNTMLTARVGVAGNYLSIHWPDTHHNSIDWSMRMGVVSLGIVYRL